MEKKEFVEIVKECMSKSDVCKKLGYQTNGNGMRKVNVLLDEFEVDVSHFDGGKSKNTKYETITKECPVCGDNFETKKGHKREKTVCSHSCSNTFFRSGKNNPNWKNGVTDWDKRYRKICFLEHGKKCIICGETNIVVVHHYDENHSNDDIDNLIPLCPTHHMYCHSRYKGLVMDKINEFRDNFIKNK